MKVTGTCKEDIVALDILRNELYEARISNLLYKNVANHTVLWNDSRALDARNILEDFGIEYHSAANGVSLTMEVNE